MEEENKSPRKKMDTVDAAWPSVVLDFFSTADIKINGNRPWDILVKHPDLLERWIRDSSVGFGESYMDGWWDCQRLDILGYKIAKHNIDEYQVNSIHDVIRILTNKVFNFQATTIANYTPCGIREIINILTMKFFNFQTKSLAWKVNEVHYNLGNDLFVHMLGPYMQYSCGYWKNAKTFEESEEDKLRLICEKLHLERGMRVLDIGCGFGGLAKYMAQNYGVSVTGVNLSSEQQKYAQEFCKGLDVTILLKDYRELEGQFDRIVSVEMIEHVGPKNYATFYSVVDRCLKPDGLFLLHVIASDKRMDKYNDWLNKYIFPNSCPPDLERISAASAPYLVIEDLHNMGADFDKTLMAWHQRFLDSWPLISDAYDERFKRMFVLFLNLSAGFLRARKIQLWHIVYSRGREGGLCVPR